MPAAATTGAPESQGETSAQPQGGASPVQGTEPQTDGSSGGQESSTVDVAELQRKLAEFERDNRRYRDEARQREEVQRKAEEAKLSDAERISKRQAELERTNAELTQRLQATERRAAVMAAAQRLGFTDPGDAYALLDPAEITGEDGQPKGVDKALKDLLAKKPYLASTSARASGSVDQGAKGGSRTDDFNTMIRRAAGRG